MFLGRYVPVCNVPGVKCSLDDASRGRRRCDPANAYGDRDEILGHQFDRRLESFAPCFLTVPSTGGFYRKPYFTPVSKIHTKHPGNKKARILS
jgi:hypothetical protein